MCPDPPETVSPCRNKAASHAYGGEGCCGRNDFRMVDTEFEPACAQKSSDCCGIYPLPQMEHGPVQQEHPYRAELSGTQAADFASCPYGYVFQPLCAPDGRGRGATVIAASTAWNCFHGSTLPSRSDAQILGSAPRSAQVTGIGSVDPNHAAGSYRRTGRMISHTVEETVLPDRK
jgi:hypothetical protein